MKNAYTYFELSMNTDCHYYAVITLKNGHQFYVSGFKSRSAAYRHAKKHPLQGK